MLHRVYALLCAFVFVCSLARGQAPQGFLSVAQSNLQDSSANKINNATVCAQVTLNGQPSSVQVGGVGVTTFSSVCAPVSNGAWTMNLPDVSVSSPRYVCLSITATDNLTGNSLLSGYSCVQPRSVPPQNATGTFWCSASSCNFDQLSPNYPASAAFVAPTGATGAAGPAATVTSNGSNGSFAVSGRALKIGVDGLPDFPGDQQSSQDPAVTVSNNYTDTNISTSMYSHGFADNSVFQRTNNAAYASFDARTRYAGNGPNDHYVGFQSAGQVNMSNSAVLNAWYGFLSGPRFVNAAAVNNLFHYEVTDLQITNAPTYNIYGFHVRDLVSGGYPWAYNSSYPYGSRWGVWVNGNASYFGGPIVQIVNNPAQSSISYPGGIGYVLRNLSTGNTDYPLIEVIAGPDANGTSFAMKATGANVSVVPNTALLDAGTGITRLLINLQNSNAKFGVNTLAGSGNAFACIDSTGNFYRSATACQ